MLFEHVKLPELQFDLQAQTTDSGRVYLTPSGKKYPSVTTVLSHYNSRAIAEWRERVGNEEANKIAGRASRRGTKLHSVCEKYLLNEITEMKMHSMMPNIKELFLKIKPYIDKNITKVYTLEQALYSDHLRIAGRVDCIAEWDGVLSVIDFKSSTKAKKKESIGNYFMQCTAYAEMFYELTGTPIHQSVVLIGVEEEDGQVFIEKTSDYYVMLKEYIGRYYDKSERTQFI